MTDDPRTEVSIRLPLPLEVVGALSEAIGTLWPDATIRTDRRDFTFMVPRRKAKRPTKKRMREILAESWPDDDAPEVDVTRINPDGMSIALDNNDEAWQQLGAWAYSVLRFHDAANYVEQQITVQLPDANEERTLLLTACWSTGQTPHALRMKAEAELAALRAEKEES